MLALSDRTVLGVFIAVIAAGCAAIWVPLERHYTNDPVERARRGEVTALHELSMLRADNAVRAVRLVEERSPAEVRVQTLTIRPTALTMTVVEPGNGTERDWGVDPGFHVGGGEAEDASSDYGVTFRALDLTVPERMARTVLDQTHRNPRDIEYASAATSATGEPVQWLLYLAGGRIRDRVWRADADGSHVRRNGT
ncbi:MAG: hypothetical protein ACJ762_09700 [Solirubrobacteraceae bacterium]